MVTINEIARRAGVSKSTVSRVLSGQSSSVKTKTNVLRITDELNYSPNGIASNLRTRKNRTLGVIIPDISNPFYPSSISAFHDTARQREYNVILGNTYGKAEEELKVLRLMSRERVSGLFLEICEGEEDGMCYPLLRQMSESGVHVVAFSKSPPDFNGDTVVIDNKAGAFKAVSYLLKTGRKRIGFICGSKSLRAGGQRFLGYREALKAQNMNIDNRLVSFGEWNTHSGLFQADNMMAALKPDSFFCANDLLAFGAINAVRSRGLRVPEDIPVVGYDDMPFASWFIPKLTTVRQPVDMIASEACGLLIDRIEGNFSEGHRDLFFEPELIVRESA